MVTRYNYWYTDNVYLGRCPSGMCVATHGEYVQYRDVAQDIVDATAFRTLVSKAQAVGTTLTELVAEATAKHDRQCIDKPRTLILPDAYRRIMPFENGRSQRIFLDEISDKDSHKDGYQAIWRLNMGITIACKIDRLGPLPDDLRQIWLEFDKEGKVFDSGYWPKESITVIWE